MEKYYLIQYYRIGVKTIHPDKNGEPMKFPSLNAARRYVNTARDNDQNNPVTFMNRVDILEYDQNGFVRHVEKY